MSDTVNDDFDLAALIKHQVRIRPHNQPTDRRVVRLCSNQGMRRQEIYESPNASLYTDRALRGARREIIQNGVKVGECGKRVANSHNPCFAQTART